MHSNELDRSDSRPNARRCATTLLEWQGLFARQGYSSFTKCQAEQQNGIRLEVHKYLPGESER